MINKRLIALMGDAKKYIAWHVIIQLVNLALNITAVFFMADIIQKASNGNITKEDIIKLCIAIFVIIVLRFRFTVLMSKMSYQASGRVKQTLREKIYSKLLTLGSRYKEKFSTSEIVQISMEGVDQLETYFGRYLPQFFLQYDSSYSTFCYAFYYKYKIGCYTFNMCSSYTYINYCHSENC
ncbi:ABC transporter transmembrane domain-containing protein [Brachyspira hampsonii]|uniref:ABC transporter transmembrane domain-containing protein n=1 Tax=Brachyspira hampsonii TaxID=1287055 RepID=UPI0003479E4C|nr:ABC transporter transmembrane domain-containing protein [Brachyspira hampsonii]